MHVFTDNTCQYSIGVGGYVTYYYSIHNWLELESSKVKFYPLFIIIIFSLIVKTPTGVQLGRVFRAYNCCYIICSSRRGGGGVVRKEMEEIHLLEWSRTIGVHMPAMKIL